MTGTHLNLFKQMRKYVGLCEMHLLSCFSKTVPYLRPRENVLKGADLFVICILYFAGNSDWLNNEHLIQAQPVIVPYIPG